MFLTCPEYRTLMFAKPSAITYGIPGSRSRILKVSSQVPVSPSRTSWGHLGGHMSRIPLLTLSSTLPRPLSRPSAYTRGTPVRPITCPAARYIHQSIALYQICSTRRMTRSGFAPPPPPPPHKAWVRGRGCPSSLHTTPTSPTLPSSHTHHHV